jgi:hypothetical protein
MISRKRVAVLAGIATAFAVGALLVVLIAGGSARTAPGVVATNSYLAARRVLEMQMERWSAKRSSVVKAYVAGIAYKCGGALRHAPPVGGSRRFVRQGSTLVLSPREILFSDATSSIELAMRLPDAVAVGRFTRKARSLRWTDPAVTELVHTLGETEEAQLEQEEPALCHDVRAWAATGYKSLAAQTSRTAERLAGLEVTLTRALAKERCVGPYLGRAVLHVLEQTMSSGQRMTAQEISRLEARVAVNGAAVLDNAVAQIEHALGGRLLIHGGAVRPPREVPPCVKVPRAAPRY